MVLTALAVWVPWGAGLLGILIFLVSALTTTLTTLVWPQCLGALLLLLALSKTEMPVLIMEAGEPAGTQVLLVKTVALAPVAL